MTFLPQQSQNLPSGGNSLPQLSQNKASPTEPVREPVDRVFELDVTREPRTYEERGNSDLPESDEMRSEKESLDLSFSRRVLLSKTFLAVVLVMLIAIGSISIYFLYPIRATNVPHVGENRAAIVDALSIQHPNPEFENTAISYLNSAGLSVDVYNASQVTVEFMKSFPAGYALVIFRVHSGTSRQGVFYFTSEPYDESKYEPEQFRDELRSAKDYEGHPSVFAFGSKFIDAYLQGRFQNAIIIGMGCFGAGTSYGTEEEVTIGGTQAGKGPNLADAFQRQGATAVIGWDVLVTLEFSDRVTLELIKALAVERLTVTQATEKVNLENGADPVYKSQLTFYPEQNGDKTLMVESQHPQPEAWTASTTSQVRTHQRVPVSVCCQLPTIEIVGLSLRRA